MMEALCSSETSVTVYQTIRRHNFYVNIVSTERSGVAVALQIHIQEFFGSNLSRGTGYPD
jgi:hypothetical protein